MRQDLTDDGWTELDPETPDDWEHHGVCNTGGNIYCRIFETERPDEVDDGNVMYEVIYGDQFDGAALNRYVFHSERRAFDGRVARVPASEQTDEACAEAAQELMTNLDAFTDD